LEKALLASNSSLDRTRKAAAGKPLYDNKIRVFGEGSGKPFFAEKGFPGIIFLKITSLEGALFSDPGEAPAILGCSPGRSGRWAVDT